MQPRFNFAKAAPDAYKAVAALEQYVSPPDWSAASSI